MPNIENKKIYFQIKLKNKIIKPGSPIQALSTQPVNKWLINWLELVHFKQYPFD